ncbi:MAG: clostripain-related cysteine peptidase [Bacteroidales bacterium]
MKRFILGLAFLLVTGAQLISQSKSRAAELIPPINISASGSESTMNLSWTKPSAFGQWESGWKSIYKAQANSYYDDYAVLFDYSTMGYTFSFPCKIQKISQKFANLGGEPAKMKFKICKPDFTTVIAESEEITVDAATQPDVVYEFQTPVEIDGPFSVVIDMGNMFSLYPTSSEVGEFGPHSYFYDAYGGGWTKDKNYEGMMAVFLQNPNGQSRMITNSSLKADPVLSGYKVYLNGSETAFATLDNSVASTWSVQNVPSGLNKVRMKAVYNDKESKFSNQVNFFSDIYCAAGADKIDEYFTNIKIGKFTYANKDFKNTFVNLGLNDQKVQLNKGVSYSVELTNGRHYVEDNMGMWIDWNGDGDFEDAGEQISIDYSTATSIGKAEFTVPANAKKGTSRVRMRVTSGKDIPACGNVKWGQVIDLIADIVEEPFASFSADKERVGVSENIKFTDASVNSKSTWKWEFGEGADPATITFNADTYKKDVNVTYSSLGEKTVKLTVDGKGSLVKKINVVSGSGSYKAPSYLQTKVSASKVDLSWLGAGETPTIQSPEDFEGIFPPAGWTVKESTTKESELIEPKFQFHWKQANADYLPDYVKPGTKYAAYVENLASDYQWLISPAFEVKKGDQLTYWVAFNNYKGPLGNAYSEFSTMIKVENDNNWTSLNEMGDKTESNVYASPIELNLKSYVGKKVKVAFVYKSKGYSLGLDNVQVVNDNIDLFRAEQPILKGYKVYRDNNLIATLSDVNVKKYSDINVPEGKHAYKVSATYSKGDSYPTEDISVNVVSAIDNLPYKLNFDEKNIGDLLSKWEVGNGWEKGNNAELSSANMKFGGNETKFIGVNSDASKERLTTYLVSPYFNLEKYGWVDLKFKYKFENKNKKSLFVLVYRAKPSEPWKMVKNIPVSADWKDYSMHLPKELLIDGVQLGFFYTDGKIKQLGAAIDDISLTFNDGKHFSIQSTLGEKVNNSQRINFGRVALNQEVSKEFVIHNTGTESLSLSSFAISETANFKIVKAPEKNIPKGGKATFIVAFNPKKSGNFETNVSFNLADKNFSFTLFGEEGNADWTWMVYMYEDGTGLDGLKDFNEMEVNGSIPGVVNYIVLYDSDDDAKDGIYYVQKDPEGMNSTIISKKISTHMNKGLDMDNWETLRDFIVWTYKKYPADHVGITVWDHGSGIFRGESKWKSAVGKVTLWDLNNALSIFNNTYKRKVDIFGFDVCLMGQAETAYQLKDNVNFVTFSEKTEPGDGWDYVAAFKRLNASNGKLESAEICKDIVNAFIDSYKPGGSSYVSSATQSAVQLDKFKAEFIPSLNKFSRQLAVELPSAKVKIKKCHDKTYYAKENPNHKDLGHFAQLLIDENISPELNKTAQELLAALSKCVIAEGHTEDIKAPLKGMKIWMTEKISTDLNADYYLDSDQYLTFSETDWDEYLKLYENPLSQGSLNVDFASNTKNLIRTDIVRIQNLSIANPFIDTYSWKIIPEDGVLFLNTTANSENPVIQFTKAGNYSVELTAVANGVEKKVKKDNYFVVSEPNFAAPSNLGFEKGDNLSVDLFWNKPGEDPNVLKDWYSYAAIDQCKNLGLFEQTAVQFSASDYSYSYPAKIEKLSFAFFNAKNGTNDWTSDKFKFRIYNPERTKILLETEDITAVSNSEVIYTLPEPFEVTGDFVVSVYRAAADFSPHSLMMVKPTGKGHSFVYQTSDAKWYKAASNGEDWEFPARVYMSCAKSNSGRKSNNVSRVSYQPLSNQWSKVVRLDDRNITDSKKVYRGAPTLTGYEVNRNGEVIATISESDNTKYTDKVPVMDTYRYTITALYSNPSGKSESSNEVKVSFGVNVQEVEIADTGKLYPNPVKNSFTIELPNSSGKELTIGIVSMDGTQVYYDKLIMPDNKYQFTNINLSSGVYILKLSINTQNKEFKLVVK